MSLYGCALFHFASRNITKLYVCWRKCIHRIYDLPNRAHSKLLHLICQDRSIDCQLHARFMKFFFNAMHSKNKCVSLCASLALHGSRSSVCNSLNVICRTYFLNKYCCFKSYVPICIPPTMDDATLATAGAIRDFILYRETNNNDDINFIINYLCTS